VLVADVCDSDRTTLDQRAGGLCDFGTSARGPRRGAERPVQATLAARIGMETLVIAELYRIGE
jgi:hypothetical protein